MPCCGLTRYGRREIVLGSILLAGACLLVGLLAWRVWPPLAALEAAPLAVWAWLLAFFRDPERTGPADPRIWVAPADGVVTDISPVGPDSPLGCEGTRIGIFMSVFSVHVNRSPFALRVEGVEHRPGAFLDARDAMASERNESATIRLSCRLGGREHPVVVRQIAGLVARRIVTDLAAGQSLQRSQRIGMIKFGSRVELLVAGRLVGEVLVKLGDKTRAGHTPVLAPPAGAEQ